MTGIKEIDVLKNVLAETKRFQQKLKDLIKERKDGNNNSYSKYRGGVKRSALDLRKELAKITTARGSQGTYYYEDYF